MPFSKSEPSPFATILLATLLFFSSAPGQTEEAETIRVGSTLLTVERGTLEVPILRRDPTAGLARLAWVRLSDKAASTGGAPLVYLAGGPGQSATWMADNADYLAAFLPILADRDLILFDQRGTGRSEPQLRWVWDGAFPLDFFRDAEVAGQHLSEMARRAARELRAKEIEPSGFTTTESADDVEALRVELGLEKISLFGFSYGTHLALSVLRRHPESVDRAVLCGVEGPDHTRKPPLNTDLQLRRIGVLAGADPKIASFVPDLYSLTQEVFVRLDQEPMLITVRDPRDDQELRLPIGSFGLRIILMADLGDASDLPVFPRLIHSVSEGNDSLLTWFIQKRIGMALAVNGMNAVMDGSSGASAHRLYRLALEAGQSLFGNVMNSAPKELTSIWGMVDLGDGFRSPISSAVPTLFLSGELDWNAPPYQAEEVRFGFAHGSHLVVQNAGHEQILDPPEIGEAIVAFLAGETVDHMTAGLPPLRFVPIEGEDRAASHPSLER